MEYAGSVITWEQHRNDMLPHLRAILLRRRGVKAVALRAQRTAYITHGLHGFTPIARGSQS